MNEQSKMACKFMSWLHKSNNGSQNLPRETTFANISKVLNLFVKKLVTGIRRISEFLLYAKRVLHHLTGMRLI